MTPWLHQLNGKYFKTIWVSYQINFPDMKKKLHLSRLVTQGRYFLVFSFSLTFILSNIKTSSVSITFLEVTARDITYFNKSGKIQYFKISIEQSDNAHSKRYRYRRFYFMVVYILFIPYYYTIQHKYYHEILRYVCLLSSGLDKNIIS